MLLSRLQFLQITNKLGSRCAARHYPLCPRQKRQQRTTGQSLIETMAGFMLLIPLGLFSYDLTYILAANQNNENLAENCARAAANHNDLASAKQAALLAIEDLKKSSAF